MTPEREAQIREAWHSGACAWRWAPQYEGYQFLNVAILPKEVRVGRFSDELVPESVVHHLTFWNRSLDDAGVEPGENETSAHVKLSRCIGSACMAWRRDPDINLTGAVGHGYCGLAGRPT